jgi:ABC-type polysaccharide/polyol phosphate transport system ATPase subunit
MSDIVIKAENIGKKYVIGHQLDSSRSMTLREKLVQNAQTLWNKTRDLAKGKPIIQGDMMEEVLALDGVSLDIRRGDIVGIIGRNGAGKSTLLKILSRITEPSTGKVTIKGRVASLLEVGTGFHPELTGRENIYLNGTIMGMTRSEIKRKFDEIVAFAEVDKYLDTPVKRYSSGMYVRLAFAVAAHLEPDILIVDEVLAVGDAQFQKKCLGKMEDVSSKEGRTVLFVSHNMSAIRQLCKTALVLDKGIIVLKGTADECVEAYSGLVESRIGFLLEHRTIEDPTISVTEFTVNETSSDFLHLVSPFAPLKIEMKLAATDFCRLSLYGYLKSKQGQAVGIYSPGHMDAISYAIKPGIHKLSAQLFLPNLTKGTYILDFGIADPGIKTYVNFPFALKLQVDGTPAKTGLVFEENRLNGFIVLGGSVNVTTVLEL